MSLRPCLCFRATSPLLFLLDNGGIRRKKVGTEFKIKSREVAMPGK